MNETFSEWDAFNNKPKNKIQKSINLTVMHVKWNNFKQDGKVHVSSITDLDILYSY